MFFSATPSLITEKHLPSNLCFFCQTILTWIKRMLHHYRGWLNKLGCYCTSKMPMLPVLGKKCKPVPYFTRTIWPDHWPRPARERGTPCKRLFGKRIVNAIVYRYTWSCSSRITYTGLNSRTAVYEIRTYGGQGGAAPRGVPLSQ